MTAPDQGNRTSELTKVLMELVSPNGKLVTVAGAKQRIERLISQEAARLADDKLIELLRRLKAEADTPFQNVKQTIYVELDKAEQRRRLDALQGGTKG